VKRSKEQTVHVWGQPSLTVRCEWCGAEPGEYCRTPSDEVAYKSHKERISAGLTKRLHSAA
jgi:hypothetical protein